MQRSSFFFHIRCSARQQRASINICWTSRLSAHAPVHGEHVSKISVPKRQKARKTYDDGLLRNTHAPKLLRKKCVTSDSKVTKYDDWPQKIYLSGFPRQQSCTHQPPLGIYQPTQYSCFSDMTKRS